MIRLLRRLTLCKILAGSSAMASGCVNNIRVSPESLIDCPKFSSYGWLSPRVSFNREVPDIGAPKSPGAGNYAVTCNEKNEESDLGASTKDFVDFEFRLEDPVGMLPADELFYDGKLVPLQLSSEASTFEVRSPETHNVRRRNEISPMDSYLFSPKAPRCSSRWKDILGLKKLYQNSKKQDLLHKTSSSDSSTNSAHKHLMHFLHKNPKSSLSSSLDLSLTIPLLKDMESDESVFVSTSRWSHSSSSSGHDELPRLSMDSEKPKPNRCHKTNDTNPPRLRVAKSPALSSENPGSMRTGRSAFRRTSETMIREVSVDSPRMNSSGKIVFHGLERSSSSPSSLYGGRPRYKHRGMERPYYANVRVTRVLNVPVCSLRGSSKSASVSGLFAYTNAQKKEGTDCRVSSGGGRNGGPSKSQTTIKNRIDRT